MTIKFIHIRECDELSEISHTGGCTLAYTPSPEMGYIFLNMSQCSVNDRFSRKTGRELAAKRLKDDGPLDIIEFTHPNSEAVRWWFMKYFNCCLIKDPKGRWCSTFVSVEEGDEPLMISYKRLSDRTGEQAYFSGMVAPEDI